MNTNIKTHRDEAVRLAHCLRINCAEWYERPDFIAWVNAEHTATWHTKGTKPGDYSDIFCTFDHEEGSDFGGDYGSCPDDIWDAICKLCANRGMQYGVIWLVNMDKGNV